MTLLVSVCLALINSTSIYAAKLSKDVKLGSFVLEGGNVTGIQDISGGAYDGKNIFLVNDNLLQLPSALYMLNLSSKINNMATIAPFQLNTRHSDLEAATYLDHSYIVSTSWSSNEPDYWSSQWLTKVTFNDECYCVVESKSVNLRKELLTGLKNNFPEPWFARISTSEPKSGGINLEGMSAMPNNKSSLLFGLRSPLAHPYFGSKSFGGDYSLNQGDAIIFRVDEPFGELPVFKFYKVNLDGKGVRSLEYIPELKKYAIISGVANRGNDYELWLWDMKSKPEKVKLPELDQLCRPETVVSGNIGNKNQLVIVSERSGKPCKGVEFNYLSIPII